jgi:hypothetical protein
MVLGPAPQTPDPALLLPRDIYWRVVHDLHRALPPPDTDDPEADAIRMRAAIAEVACLVPANAVEARLAADFVAANACAMQALQQSQDPGREFKQVTQCRAQAASMFRQTQGLLRTLLRLQAVREKREANAAALDREAWTEHCALGLMMDAMPGIRPQAAAPADTAEPPPPPAQPAPPTEQDEEPPCDPIALAEDYARHYPNRAGLIRRHGGVPASARFGPPDADITHALVTGHTPDLLALDRMEPCPT